MRNKTVLEDLDAKISLILERYNYLKSENIKLKEENSRVTAELQTTKEALESKKEEITKLKEEDELKDLELEDIALKISQSMGLVQKEEATVLA